MAIFVIGDIHGCLPTLTKLLDRIVFSTTDSLYLLGDLIDRGTDSKGVIDLIRNLKKSGHNVNSIMGNHEAMMLHTLKDPGYLQYWKSQGGKETMESFGLDKPAQLSYEYLEFFRSLPFYLEIGNFLLVHAGFDFTMSNPLEDPNGMLWQRKWYESINYPWLGDRYILHGHTPIPKSRIEYQLKYLETYRFLDLDAGCVWYNRKKDVGQLCCFNMTERTLLFEDFV